MRLVTAQGVGHAFGLFLVREHAFGHNTKRGHAFGPFQLRGHVVGLLPPVRTCLSSFTQFFFEGDLRSNNGRGRQDVAVVRGRGGTGT